MIIESSTSTIPLLFSSATLSLSSSPGIFHHRPSNTISKSFSRRIPCFSSLTLLSPRRPSTISISAAFSGGGGGDELPGGSGSGGGGGGGDGGSSGRVAEKGSFVGETEEDLALGSDVIFINVGGMTCGGCAASVKRILESQPQVASATVYLEKEIAVVWTVSEAKVIENWQQQIGEKLANHLTTCGFKSEFQGQGEAIEKGL